MSKLTLTEVKGVRTDLRNEISGYLPEWWLASQFVAPQRYRNAGQKDGVGIRNGSRIVKNTAGRALRTFTSGMMNGATPRARPWFNLTVNNASKSNSSSSKRYFSIAEKVLNNYLQVSNFYGVMPLAYKDVGVFSNSAFAMLPHARYGFYFYPFAVGTYAFACDAEGNTNMFTRDFTYSVRQVVDNYAKLSPTGHIEWTNIPDWVKNQWDNKNYLEKVMLSQTILPNPDWYPGKKTLFAYDKKFQAYTHVEGMGGDLPNQYSTGFRNERRTSVDEDFLKVSGYSYFPVITPRWEVQAEENYGVDGPTQMAISDVMMQQEMERSRLEAVSKLVKPPMVAPASMRRHQASILAGGITYVDEAGMNHGFKPAFEMDPKLNDLLNAGAEYAQDIKSSYYEDLFLLLSGTETKTHVTAREIDEKAAERMSALAPVLGQLDKDCNGKIIDNAQMILEEAGLMPKRPQELMDEKLRPEYISILAQASKVAMMNSVERTMNFAISVANSQQDQALLRLIPGERIIREYANYTALDPSLILDENEFAKIKTELANIKSKELQNQQNTVDAQVAKDLSSAEVGKGSMLDTLLTASGV